MQINNAAPLASPKPRTAAPPAAAPAEAAPQDSVQLSAQTLMQEAIGLRQQAGLEVVQNVITQAPEEFHPILAETDSLLTQKSQAMAQQGLMPDQFFMLASETRKLAQAGVSAEMRAEFRESQQQPADRVALLREELGFQAQAEILFAAFPEQAAQVAQRPVEGEAALTGKTFVDAMLAGLPADQAEQVRQGAAFSPLAQVVAAKPELVEKAGASLAQTAAVLVGVTQGLGQYMGFITENVLPREAQAGELLAQAQA